MSNSVQEQTLATVFGRYDRCVTNNIHRADYVECLVATLLGPAWTLPWRSGNDWAPWGLEHVSGLGSRSSKPRRTNPGTGTRASRHDRQGSISRPARARTVRASGTVYCHKVVTSWRQR